MQGRQIFCNGTLDTVTYETYSIPVVGNPKFVAASPDGKKIYVSPSYSTTVIAIDISTNSMYTIPVGSYPQGIAFTPDGTKVYVANYYSNTVSVIDTATKAVTATVSVGTYPVGVAVSPDSKTVYITNTGEDKSVSVIDTATNEVIDTVPVGNLPYGVAIGPDGKKVYVTNSNDDTVSVIDTATNEVIDTVSVGYYPIGVAVTLDGAKAYVANNGDDTISVIDTSTNTVTTSIKVGSHPSAFGQFIGSVLAPALEPILPEANFSTNVTQGYAPLSVNFADLSINSTSRNWDFENDGNIDSTEEAPVYVYTTPGTYTVNLTATNANGTDSKLATINVLKQPLSPVASFRGNVTSGYAPLTVQFTDLSEDATEWSWDFGDKTYSTEQNPVHTYSKDQKYTVSLTVNNSLGTDTETKEKYISASKIK